MSKQPTTSAEPAPAPATAPGNSGMVGKVTVLALILAVILGECLAAFFFLGRGESATAAGVSAPEEEAAHAPKPAPKKKEAHGGGHSSHGSGGHGNSDGGAVHAGDHTEVDLGEYSIMATAPASSTMLLVDFHIFGTIATAEQPEFEQRYEENRHRIRHQVIITVRSAEMSDLTDASLSLIRRQILEKCNQLLGKPLIEEIIFSKFSFIEQ